jgi:hypothetical protein
MGFLHLRYGAAVSAERAICSVAPVETVVGQAQAVLLRCQVQVGAAVDIDAAVGSWFRAMCGVSHLSSAWLRAGVETEALTHPVQGSNGCLEAGARRDPVVGGASSASSGTASAPAAHGCSAAAASVGSIVAVARCVLGRFRRTGGGGIDSRALASIWRAAARGREALVRGRRAVFSLTMRLKNSSTTSARLP